MRKLSQPSKVLLNATVESCVESFTRLRDVEFESYASLPRNFVIGYSYVFAGHSYRSEFLSPEAHTAGQLLEIALDPDAPAKSRVCGLEPSRRKLIWAVIGGVALAVFLIILGAHLGWPSE